MYLAQTIVTANPGQCFAGVAHLNILAAWATDESGLS